MRRRVFKRFLFYTSSCFIVAMMLSLLMLFATLSAYREGALAHDTLMAHVVAAPSQQEQLVRVYDRAVPPEEPKPEPEPEPEPEEEVFVRETFTLPYYITLPEVNFDALREINPNAVAWLLLEGTPINYPVVHWEDNYRYLDHLFNGTRNRAGAIFVDSYNQPGFVDQNNILYGHNMRDGSMFAALERYRSQAFFDANPWIFLLTPEGNYVIQLFAGFVTDVYGPSWRLEFADEEDFLAWVYQARNRSDFVSDVEVDPRDQLMTFSTCSFAFHNARYVIVGRMLPIAE